MRRKIMVALAVGAVGLAVPGVLAPTPTAAEPPALDRSSGGYAVTLPTGDKVHVDGERIFVTPASGRSPAFSVSHSGEDLYVIPSDRFSDDPERYNVTALHHGPRPAAETEPKTEPKDSGDLVTVHVKSIARDGRPGLGVASFHEVDDGSGGAARRSLPGDPGLPCTDERGGNAACIRLEPGTYSVLGLIKTLPSWAPSTQSRITPLNFSLVGYPEIEITRDDADTEIVLDARKATEVTVDTPEHATEQQPGSVSHLRWTRSPAKGPALDDGVYLRGNSSLEGRVFIQPMARVRTGAFEVYTRWRLKAPDITMRTQGVALNPQYYDPAYFSDVSSEFPRLDGQLRLRVADGDRPGADLRGRLALIQRQDGVSVAELSNRAARAGARMVAIYNDKPGVNADTGGSGVQLTVPTVWLSHEEGRALLSRSHATVVATGISQSPYLYQLVYAEKGQVPKDLHYVARPRDLARVVNTYNGSGSLTTVRYSQRPWEEFSLTYSHPLPGTSRTRVEYLSADQETAWMAGATAPERPYNHAFPRPDTPYVRLSEPTYTTYRPGERRSHTWFEAPLAGGLRPMSPIMRNGDQMNLRVGLRDAAGNYADAYTSSFPEGFATDFRVYRDGDLIAQTNAFPRGSLLTTPDEAEYRIEYDFTNHATWAKTSTRVRTSWTFRSAHAARPMTLPLLEVGYDAHVDRRNRARNGRLELAVGHQDGSSTPLKQLSLEVSYDDGTTWTKVRVRHGIASLRGKGMVSLRITAEDTAGSRIVQEVIRAYELR